MKNIEIKSPLENRGEVEDRLRSLDAHHVWTRHQRDTFYRVDRGWLKLREGEGVPAELISYQRSTENSGPRASVYHREPLEDAGRWHSLLGHVLERETVVTKTRSLWRLHHTRVHLDQVEGLGDFLELETVLDGIEEDEGREESDAVIAALGLDPARFLARPYRDLLG